MSIWLIYLGEKEYETLMCSPPPLPLGQTTATTLLSSTTSLSRALTSYKDNINKHSSPRRRDPGQCGPVSREARAGK